MLAMDCYKNVGWMHDYEWEAVYYNLYYGDKLEIRAALDQMAVWRARFVKKVPVAIEATSQLFESRLFVGDENCMVKRQCMATAISQFLGLLTERTLKGNLQRRPIHAVGLELGIPEWFTNLRNEIAHGKLPSFWMLNTAVNYALDWLKYNYWEKEYDEMEKEYDEASDIWVTRATMVALLKDCLSTTQKNTSTQKLSDEASFASQKLKSLVSSKPALGYLLCSVLFENNFVNIDSKFPPLHLFSPTKKVQLIPEAKIMFEKIISLLAESQALNCFFDNLIYQMKFSHPVPRSMFYFWFDFVIEILRSNDGLRKYVNWSQLVKTCINSRVSSRMIELIINISEVKNKGFMVELLRCIAGSHNYLGAKFDEIVMTKKYKDQLEEVCKKKDTSTSFVKTDAIKCAEETNACSGELSTCPLGLMPGQDPKILWKCLCSNALKSVIYFCPRHEERDNGDENSIVTESLTLEELQYIKSEMDLY